MEVAVWDTYVTKKNGLIMHFDIIAPSKIKDASIIYRYGNDYLLSKGEAGQPLSSKECRFCHVRGIQENWETEVISKGYFILEMENCS
jgi:hypothetical protein